MKLASKFFVADLELNSSPARAAWWVAISAASSSTLDRLLLKL